jgi:hypothetical protein
LTFISSLVAFYLAFPKTSISRRERGAGTILMAMPETTVREHDRFLFPQNNIRRTRQISSMSFRLKSELSEDGVQQPFRGSILPFDLRHDL